MIAVIVVNELGSAPCELRAAIYIAQLECQC